MDDDKTIDNVSKTKGAGLAVTQAIVTVGFNMVDMIISGFFALTGIYLYFEYKDAKCEESLESWLLVMGITEFVMLFFILIKILEVLSCTAVNLPSQAAFGKNAGAFDMLKAIFDLLFSVPKILLALFSLAWLIVGTVWIVNSDPNDTGCPDNLYDWTLGLIIVMWVMRIVGLIIISLMVCISCCCAIFSVAIMGIFAATTLDDF